MSEERSDLDRTKELFDFLQGVIPEGYKIPRAERANLTPDQAWTAIWYIQNQYWQVPDKIERCEVCGRLYDSHREGDTLDYGKAPYSFCESCMAGEDYARKAARQHLHER